MAMGPLELGVARRSSTVPTKRKKANWICVFWDTQALRGSAV